MDLLLKKELDDVDGTFFYDWRARRPGKAARAVSSALIDNEQSATQECPSKDDEISKVGLGRSEPVFTASRECPHRLVRRAHRGTSLGPDTSPLLL